MSNLAKESVAFAAYIPDFLIPNRIIGSKETQPGGKYLQISTKQLGKPGTLPALTLIMQFALFFTVLFNVPTARQVIGFLFLTLIPGFAIMRLVKLKLERTEAILIAVGLSISFLMISALVLDLILPIIGITRPLDLIPLMLVACILVVPLVIFQWRNSDVFAFSAGSIELTLSGSLLSVPLILTVVGVSLARIPPGTNNILLLVMLITISTIVGSTAFLRKLIPNWVYPILLFVIAMSLLFHVSLFSSYPQGGDIFGEYYVFRSTVINSHWNPNLFGRLSSMLSVTILPTIYSVILNLNPTWVLKIVYPLIFALVPLGLYQLYKSKMGKEIAFFSVFFFVSNLVFFTEIADLARQMIGELFYVLLFLTLFSNNIKGFNKWLLIILFGFGLIVSHYALAILFLVFVAVAWLIGFIKKHNVKLTLALVVLFAILAFSWYIFISGASTFNDIVGIANYVGINFGSDFFNPQSRGTQTLAAVGISGIPTFWHTIGRYVYYVTEALILLGFLDLFLRRRTSFFNDEYNVLVFCNLLLLGACIVVPNFSAILNISRFYHITLFFLAPLCVLGWIDTLKFLSKKKIKDKYLTMALVLIVLIPFFLFQTGFVYEVTREETDSVSLSSYRFTAMELANAGILTDAEVSSGAWLSQHRFLSSYVYADITTGVICLYTGVNNMIPMLSGTTVRKGSYIYLREYNVENGIVFSDYSFSYSFDGTQITPNLNKTNMIYSGGQTEIYQVP